MYIYIYINMKTINDQEVRYCTVQLIFWVNMGLIQGTKSRWWVLASKRMVSWTVHHFFPATPKIYLIYLIFGAIDGLDWLDVSRIP